ncbi:hypothetical protein GJ496_005454 [Pomphorhynchus laevis]|nr:hypothetical protein GJ496_005454 [Pomphorhynchus laevis]
MPSSIGILVYRASMLSSSLWFSSADMYDETYFNAGLSNVQQDDQVSNVRDSSFEDSLADNQLRYGRSIIDNGVRLVDSAVNSIKKITNTAIDKTKELHNFVLKKIPRA